jgi:hypothetical protein
VRRVNATYGYYELKKITVASAVPLDSKHPFPDDKRMTDAFKQTLSP